jgi:lysylphosphatidylglycerol synthetase-like protein (DUF2156 family)
MDSGAPPQPDKDGTPRHRAGLAAWCLAAAVILALVALTCSLLGVVSSQQAVALGLVAVLLIASGLIAAGVPDEGTGHWLGFRSGLYVGSLLRGMRNLFRRRNRELATAHTDPGQAATAVSCTQPADRCREASR